MPPRTQESRVTDSFTHVVMNGMDATSYLH
jgi:hypothetical protein